MTDLANELSTAQNLALIAGKLALKLQNTVTVKQKPNNEGPVTNADLLIDKFICYELKKNFPNDKIISEESYNSSISIPQNGRVWYIDPIDGTYDYIKNGDDYAVMIGLSIEHEPILGVVYQPKKHIIWKGITNNKYILSQKINCKKEIKTLNIKNRYFPQNGPILVISRNYSSKFVNYIAKKFKISKVIQLGSIGLKLAMIAEGKADFYVTCIKKLKLWDTCAPGAILRAAGGKLCTINGEKLVFDNNITHKIELFAASPNYNNWFKTIFIEALKNYKSIKKNN